MKYLQGALCLVVMSAQVFAADVNVAISSAQLTALGVKTGGLTEVENLPLLEAPARVVVPPQQESVVATTVSGLVSQLQVAAGDPVVAGDLLAYVDSPELLTLQQKLLQADTEWQLADSTYRRDRKLWQEGIIAEKRWQETQSHYRRSSSSLQEIRRLLEIAGMSPDAVRNLLRTHQLSGRLSMQAPISGVVLERLVSAGQRLAAMEPLFRIADLEQLWLEIRVPQEKRTWLQVGDEVVGIQQPVRARVAVLGQSVNPGDQTVVVRAIVEQAQPRTVYPGQILQVRVVQDAKTPLFKVPARAVVQADGQAHVLVMNQQGFSVVPVKVYGRQGQSAVIGGQLDGQEQIAVSGTIALKAVWLGLGEGEE